MVRRIKPEAFQLGSGPFDFGPYEIRCLLSEVRRELVMRYRAVSPPPDPIVDRLVADLMKERVDVSDHES